MLLLHRALLLASALSTVVMAQTQTLAPPAPPPALVTVTGEHKIAYVPDEVAFSFNIESESEDLTAAKQKNAAAVAKIIGYLRSAGIADEDVQTRYLNVSTQYRQPDRTRPRYLANQYVNVTLRDVSRFDEVNTGLLQRGVTGLNGPNFGYSKIKEARERARIEAVKDAKRKAVALAAALQQRIGPAYAIDAAEAGWTAHPPMGARMMAMESADAGIAVGESEARSTVTVSFYLYAE